MKFKRARVRLAYRYSRDTDGGRALSRTDIYRCIGMSATGWCHASRAQFDYGYAPVTLQVLLALAKSSTKSSLLANFTIWANLICIPQPPLLCAHRTPRLFHSMSSLIIRLDNVVLACFIMGTTFIGEYHSSFRSVGLMFCLVCR